MNRKQQAAIAVGGIVVVLLVLFPTFVPPDSEETADFRWLRDETPSRTRRWIGSDPPVRLAEKDDEVMVLVDPRGHWSGMIPSSWEVIENADGSTTVVENWEPDYREEIETRTTTIGLPFALATTDLAFSLLATLAITAAAVFVLRTRTDAG